MGFLLTWRRVWPPPNEAAVLAAAARAHNAHRPTENKGGGKKSAEDLVN
jgi:hypothetical protein